MLDQVKGGLIVSCQALENEPLHSSFIMGRMARAAAEGGAVGIRANTAADINEFAQNTDLPIIGIVKRDYEGSPIYITPTLQMCIRDSHKPYYTMFPISAQIRTLTRQSGKIKGGALASAPPENRGFIFL